MALFCTYIVYQLGEWGVAIGFALVLGMVAGFALGALTEVVLVRPVGKRSPFAVFIVTIGLFRGLNWLDGAIWGDQVLPNSAKSKQLQFPSLFPNKPHDFWRIFGANITKQSIGILTTVLVLTALLFLLFNRTKLGLAMRAVASNTDSARLVGIPTHRVLMASWGLAAAIGALGGVVFAGVEPHREPGADVQRLHLRVGGRDARRLRQPRRARSSAGSRSASSRTWWPVTPTSGSGSR